MNVSFAHLDVQSLKSNGGISNEKSVSSDDEILSEDVKEKQVVTVIAEAKIWHNFRLKWLNFT